ncbi:hypothetical protein CK203_019306 [Vitis vinifera]|uniref:Uncharacterized protein n=1 Tax=Vitis vinifera TaxID=29760 RepID=A0A438J7N5_VITVI|nr:hypothetical protein CK203_019306 [Vitis vinifera]
MRDGVSGSGGGGGGGLVCVSRLAVVFLAFDVFFMMFCIGMACIFFFALFCCIPLAAIAYAMKIREVDDDKKQALEAAVELGSSSSISDLALHPEDSVKYSYSMDEYKETGNIAWVFLFMVDK